MELIWDIPPHSIPICCSAFVLNYGKCRKLAPIHIFPISFHMEVIWDIQVNTMGLAAMENLWHYQLFLPIENPYLRKVDHHWAGTYGESMVSAVVCPQKFHNNVLELWEIYGITSCSCQYISHTKEKAQDVQTSQLSPLGRHLWGIYGFSQQQFAHGNYITLCKLPWMSFNKKYESCIQNDPPILFIQMPLLSMNTKLKLFSFQSFIY